MKKALITGITGQDGSYLAEFLLNKDYDVYGIIRRSSSINTERLDNIFQDPHEPNPRLHLIYGDTTDAASLYKILNSVQPDEVYHLAAQSHVRISFDVPDYTANVDGLGTLRILDAILNTCPKAKFYNAATSELYGLVQAIPQNEKTPFYPRSPYAVAKLYGYWITINYREAYNLFACNGILFNHEGNRRGENFVTKKITQSVAKIKRGLQDKIYLGNLSAKRDWGYAKDYIEGMWLMLQQDKPDDFVLATGETHSVEEFCLEAFKLIDMPLTFVGDGLERKGIDNTGIVRIEIDPHYFRPTEVDLLLGDASKAKTILNWEPKVKFKELVKIMVEYDLEQLCITK